MKTLSMSQTKQLPSRKASPSYKNNNNGGKLSSWLKAFCKGFGLLLTYELIEELIEEAIAYTITTIIAKAASFLLVVFLTQTVKASAKGLAKGITVVLKPAIKKLTYKEGNDKITKLLRFINMCKDKIQNNKFLNWLKNNPKSILGIVSGFIASLSGGAITAGGLYLGNVEIPLWATIVSGCVVFGVLFALVALGVTGAGFESPVKKMVRQLAVKLGFGAAVEALEKTEAQYEADAEAERLAAEAKAEAERVEKEKAIEKYTDAWHIEVARKSTKLGLDEYIAQKEAELAEVKAKQAAADEARALENAQTEWIKAATTGGYKGSFEEWYAENKK